MKIHLCDYTSKDLLVAQFEINGSPSKNPDIKTPLVVSFLLGVVIHFSPLAAFSCQGSSKDSHCSSLSQSYLEPSWLVFFAKAVGGC